LAGKNDLILNWGKEEFDHGWMLIFACVKFPSLTTSYCVRHGVGDMLYVCESLRDWRHFLVKMLMHFGITWKRRLLKYWYSRLPQVKKSETCTHTQLQVTVVTVKW